MIPGARPMMIRLPFRPFACLAIALAWLTWLAQPAGAQGAGQPALVQQFGDWGVYTGTSAGSKVCFALAQPASAETVPPNRPRDAIYFFVSARPAENVRNEVSIIIGYPFKPGSDATAELGGAQFTLQTQGDNAWVRNPAEEGKLVEAMRAGADMIVKGMSGRGTQTIDRYSLRGLGQALERVGQECR